MKYKDGNKNVFVTLDEVKEAEETSADIVLRAIVRKREKQFFNNSMGYYRRYLLCDIPSYNFNVCKA